MNLRRVVVPSVGALVSAVLLINLGGGCEGSKAGALGAGGHSGGAGGSGNIGGAAELIFRPCTPETNVGAFNVSLVEAMGTTPEFAILGGRVQDGVNPLTYLHADAMEGDCRLMVRPTCSPGCASPQSCGVGTQCVDEPRSHSVGSVDVTGLSTPVTGLVLLGNQYNKDLSAGTYPPAMPGAAVTLSASGGDYAAFSLRVRGIEPLQFGGTGITVNRDQALAFTWTPPAQGATGKVTATLNIAYHGGGKAQIDCDLDDDGTGEIPSGLVNKLIDAGTAGFPTLALTRRSVDSTTLTPPGCIQFEVSAFRERQVTVCPQPGVCIISCGPENPCPTGMACGNDKKCG